jgi:hypothetical protein
LIDIHYANVVFYQPYRETQTMKKQLLILAMGASMLMSAPVAMATDSVKLDAMAAKSEAASEKIVQNQPLAVSKVLENLGAKGYVGLRAIELDDGVYKADVVTAQGEVKDVKINRMTGELMGTKGEAKHLSMVDIAKKVEGAGYRIIKIKADEDVYKVKALDVEGKKSGLKVDAVTGEIDKKWFD